MRPDLIKYKEELSLELENILSYWKNLTVDEVNGGFVGKIDNNNNIDYSCLLYTSPSPRDQRGSRMPSSA